MSLNIYVFVGQCIIFFNQHEFINAKPMIGRNISQARAEEFSNIVSLMRIIPGHPQSGGDHFCTGILTTRRDILTAAHCLEDESLNTVQVVVDTIDLRNGTVHFPFWWQTHDQWAVLQNISIVFDMNDMANMRLIESVSSQIHPARLSSLSNTDLYGADVITASWGINNQGITPDIMQVAYLKILTRSVCERRIEKLAHERIEVDIRILCTAVSPHILLEMGDSGGPLLFRNRLIAINKGTCPDVPNRPYHRKQVNIHVGIHYFRTFINFYKNYF